jgi:hypothetical protein
MKKFAMFFVVFVFAFFASLPAEAQARRMTGGLTAGSGNGSRNYNGNGVGEQSNQNQAGAVKIAEAIRSNDDTTTADFTKCVASLKDSGAGVKDAIKACAKVVGIKPDTAARIAKQAASATKASRPQVIVTRGYYY